MFITAYFQCKITNNLLRAQVISRKIMVKALKTPARLTPGKCPIKKVRFCQIFLKNDTARIVPVVSFWGWLAVFWIHVFSRTHHPVAAI